MNFLKRLWFVFTYSNEIEALLKTIRSETNDALREAKKHQLDLCIKHQPASPGSHFADHNCDYCRLEIEVEVQHNALCDLSKSYRMNNKEPK